MEILNVDRPRVMKDQRRIGLAHLIEARVHELGVRFERVGEIRLDVFDDLRVVQKMIDELLQQGTIVVRIVGELLAQLLVQVEEDGLAEMKL